MAIAHPPLPTPPAPPSPPPEEPIDPRLFRERPFGLWALQLLLAGGLVWMMVSGLRAVQQRDAQRKASERAGDQACGLPFPHTSHKKQILILALSEDEARANTQEGTSPEDQRGLSQWLRRSSAAWGKIGWHLRPSSLWTLSNPPLSPQQQIAISRNLAARCQVDAVLSTVLTTWATPKSPTLSTPNHHTHPTPKSPILSNSKHPIHPTPKSPIPPNPTPPIPSNSKHSSHSSPKSPIPSADPTPTRFSPAASQQPRLPESFSFDHPAPTGFRLRTLISFNNTALFAKTADQPPRLLAHLPKDIILPDPPPTAAILPTDAPFLQILEAMVWIDLLRVAQNTPEPLYRASLVHICRLLQRGGATLAPFCQEPLRDATPSVPPNIPQIPIPSGEVWITYDGKERLQQVAPFSIDRDEADRAYYAACAVAGRCPPLDDLFALSWSLPRDRLRVKDAQAACRWRNMTLPTEAQWMIAARGSLRLPNGPNPFPKRPYPWGENKHDCQRANLRWCFPIQRNGVQVPSLLPIHRPLGDISPFGVQMLAGNVAEMMRDGLIKGGSAFSQAHPLDWRGRIELRQGLSWVGFRCVKEP